mmetsp:Transcript_106097/g.228566  ORF Transcript_106097/g.228566 Transcript_106097/m.228566 type:complete len:135 (-) Transcript_106097:157-561(-)|eukprot:CAMPEP_0116925398 /NCGR_PEP_ID=MMETSP0467-20121206/24096_1 /TAXON_ID=283647 /ORGANISM="Mesodinium pulex, Strain SPMC105" /LENGTH=134 /DNA_ID=CAMNT_0004604437 /DNA_START=33 /DNA_END=437 /DNA_ORIENTATION=+
MADVTLRTRKFMRNSLLNRRQMVVDVIHPGKAPVAKSDLAAKLAKLHKADPKNVYLFGFRTAFGGGKSTGFGLIYDTEDDAKKFEAKHRLVRAGLKEKSTRSRKAFKDLKLKKRTTWGTGRRADERKKRKAAAS